MKIHIGRNPDADFHIYGDDGKEITETLNVKELSMHIEPGISTKVTMTCYVDDITVLPKIAEVIVVGTK